MLFLPAEFVRNVGSKASGRENADLSTKRRSFQSTTLLHNSIKRSLETRSRRVKVQGSNSIRLRWLRVIRLSEINIGSEPALSSQRKLLFFRLCRYFKDGDIVVRVAFTPKKYIRF